MKGKKVVDEKGVLLPFLTEDIISQILVKVPAKYLFKDARLVCKSWNTLITSHGFISKNYKETKEELLIQWPLARFHKVQQIEIDKTHLDSKFRDLGLHRTGQVRTSCNGLLLVNHRQEIGSLQVFNPFTKSCITVPKPPSGCKHNKCGAALVFDSSINQFKVVHIYNDMFGFEIFDLGCSERKWRKVPGPWREVYERPFNYDEFHWVDPVLVEGRFLNWNVNSDKYLISMDVFKEEFITTSLPDIGKRINMRRFTLLELGGCVSFGYNGSEKQFDFWVLEDLQGKVWSKKFSLRSDLVECLVAKPSSSSSINSLPNFGKIVPIGGTSDGELLIFKHKNCSLYVYDTKRNVMKKFGSSPRYEVQIIPYKNSMFRIPSL